MPWLICIYSPVLGRCLALTRLIQSPRIKALETFRYPKKEDVWLFLGVRTPLTAFLKTCGRHFYLLEFNLFWPLGSEIAYISIFNQKIQIFIRTTIGSGFCCKRVRKNAQKWGSKRRASIISSLFQKQIEIFWIWFFSLLKIDPGHIFSMKNKSPMI